MKLAPEGASQEVGRLVAHNHVPPQAIHRNEVVMILLFQVTRGEVNTETIMPAAFVLEKDQVDHDIGRTIFGAPSGAVKKSKRFNRNGEFVLAINGPLDGLLVGFCDQELSL